MISSIFTNRIDWRGTIIEVRYEPNWLGSETGFECTAHLQVCSITPPRAPLPITETGYKSHFTRADRIDAEGGPLEYVRAWLDHAALSPEWLAKEAAGRQLSLF